MTFSLSRTRIFGAGLACASAAGIALVASLSGPAGAAAPDARDHFSVLKQAAGPGDSSFFASAIGKQLAGLNADSTPDPSAARTRIAGVAGAPGSSREISVTSATNGSVCLGHRDNPTAAGPVFTNCASIEAAAKYGLVSISHPAPGPGVDPGSTSVTALLPDGVSSVGFLLKNGTRQSASVTDNTVTAHLENPASMSFNAGAGAQNLNLGGQ